MLNTRTMSMHLDGVNGVKTVWATKKRVFRSPLTFYRFVLVCLPLCAVVRLWCYLGTRLLLALKRFLFIVRSFFVLSL
jgi:hypothetical protein